MEFTAAIAELSRAAETCEHNAPIHEAEGNAEQAAFSRANAANYRAAIETLHAAPPMLTEADVNAIVNRFLAWKLPKDFCPDAGISFVPSKPYEGDEYGNSWWPIGTNLLTAEQAKAMFVHALGSLLKQASAA
jgi:hypothetical protein